LPKKTFKKLYISDILSIVSIINQKVKDKEDLSKLLILNQIQIRDLIGLETTIETPFQSFGGYQPYKDVFAISGALLYFLSRSQNFLDGNKRMSILITSYFLYINGYALNIPPIELYEITKIIVLSRPSQKDNLIKALSEVISSSSLKRVAI
jgi:death-on-curing protein